MEFNPEIVYILHDAGMLGFIDMINICYTNKKFYGALYGIEFCNSKSQNSFNDKYFITNKYFLKYTSCLKNPADNFLFVEDDLYLVEQYLLKYGYKDVYGEKKHEYREICWCSVLVWYFTTIHPDKTHNRDCEKYKGSVHYTKLNIIAHKGTSRSKLYVNITPLHIAIFLDNTNLVKLLLKYIPNDKIDKEDAQGNTPLAVACYVGNIEIIKMLIARGANINTVDKYDRDLMYYSYNSPKSIEYLLLNSIEFNETKELRDVSTILAKTNIDPKKFVLTSRIKSYLVCHLMKRLQVGDKSYYCVWKLLISKFDI